MKVVVRHALADRRHVYAFHIPEFVTYEGEEVPSPKWSPNSFCMTTGDPSFPIRMIDRERIVSIDDKASQPSKSSPVKVFTVDGSRGNKYTVTIEGSRASCTCQGFTFRKHCKHVEQTIKSLHS